MVAWLNRVAGNELTNELESSDTGQKQNEWAGKKTFTCSHPVP